MARLFYKCCRLGLCVLSRLLAPIRVVGRERIPRTGPLIIASNHASFLDPMVAGVASTRPLGFMARRSLFDNWFFGRLIRGLGAFPLNREGDSREALRTFEAHLAEGEAIMLFPEGTRTVTGWMADLKPGAAMLAARTRAPVLPLFIWGTYHIWPKGRKRGKLRSIKAFFGEPIHVPEDAKKREAQRYVQERLERCLRALEAEAWTGEEPPTPLSQGSMASEAANPEPTTDESGPEMEAKARATGEAAEQEEAHA